MVLQLLARDRTWGFRQRERLNRHHPLIVQPQRRSTGDQHHDVGIEREHPGQLTTSFKHVLGAVEDHHRAPSLSRLQGMHRGHHGRHDEFILPQVLEIHPAHPQPCVGNRSGRQRRLPDPARTDQRDDPCRGIPQQVRQQREVLVPTDNPLRHGRSLSGSRVLCDQSVRRNRGEPRRLRRGQAQPVDQPPHGGAMGLRGESALDVAHGARADAATRSEVVLGQPGAGPCLLEELCQ